MQLRERKHVKCVQERGTRIQREENVSKSPLKVSLVNLNQPLEPTHQLNNQLNNQPLNKQRRKEPEVDG